MDFSDEHYVKFFTRDTVTWNRWPWQAQAVLGPLMRKLSKAGVADIDERFGVAESVAALLGGKWPVEVVRVAIDAFVESGTLELVAGKLVMPKFLEGQESRKTKQVIAHDYRQKQRDVARAKSAGILKTNVTIRDTAGQPVTSRDPPALPSPTPALPDPELLPLAKKPRAPKPEKPTDPRHQPLIAKLDATFKAKRGIALPFAGGRHAALVTRLLGAKPADHSPDLWPITLAAAWERALDAVFPTCDTLEQFEKQLARHIAAPARRDGPDPNDAIVRRPLAGCAVCSAASIGKFANVEVCGSHYRDAEAEALRVNPSQSWAVDLSQWAATQLAAREVAA